MATLCETWPHANFTFHPPPGREDVSPARVFRNKSMIVLPWDLSAQELAEITRTGQVFLSIMGQGMPPVYVGSETEVRGMVADYGPVWPRVKA